MFTSTYGRVVVMGELATEKPTLSIDDTAKSRSSENNVVGLIKYIALV